MALLASCWLIIEAFMIPNGLVKWFYLSFYINPFFLLLCQLLYLWKRYIKWVLMLLFFPLKSIPYILVSDFVKNCIFSFLYNLFFSVYNRANQEKDEVFYDFDSTHHTIEDEKLEICNRFNYQIANSCYSNIIVDPPPTLLFGKIDIKKDGFECDDHLEEEEVEQETFISKNIECVPIICRLNSSKERMNYVFLSSPPPNIYDEPISIQNSSDEQMMMNSISSLLVSADLINLPVVLMRRTEDEEEEEVDSYYNKYTERMRWFDVLNQDTTYRFSAILNNQYLVSPNSKLQSFTPQNLSSPSKMAKKSLIRSLESDFELIYVAQSCLSWELLQHQYRKVKALASSSSSQNGQFEGNIAGEFQKFHVFLYRFLEDEICEGKRVLNYVRGRFSVKSLVQVPAISGFYEEENEYMMKKGSTLDEVLGAIESCIGTFWEFVKSDDHKSWWKLRPPSTVEDPRELDLLVDLTTTLRKKEIQMKDLQGKARCWLKKVVNIPIQESQGQEMLLAMVDMKLVSRVLHMSTLSSSQLKWCHQKLQNIEFRQGQIFRTCTTLFFPTS